MSPIASALRAFRSGEGLKGQLLRGGVGSIAVKIASTVLNLVLAIVLARLLGAEGFGVYSFVFALITIMAIPAQMGLPNLVVRETAKAQATGDWALMKGLWRWSTIMALIMSLILMVTGAAAAWIFAGSLPEGGLAVFYWGLVLVPLVALGNLRGAALRGLRHVVQGQLPEFILRPAFFIILVLGMHFGLSARALSASDAMMMHALASLVTFAIGAHLLLRSRPPALRSQSNSATHPRLWLKSALPLGMVEGMQIINQNVGIIALGVFHLPDTSGLFRVALQAGTLVGFVLSVVNMAISPYFARLYTQGDMSALRRLVTLCARLSFCSAAIIALVLVIFGDSLLSLMFGDEFNFAYQAVVIIAISYLFSSFAGPVGYLLYMTNHENDVFWAVGAATLINILLCLILTPSMGLNGASFALLVSIFTWHVLLVIRVRQRIGVDSTVLGWHRR